MTDHPIVSREEWDAQRRQLLAEEKQFTKLRDTLSAKRRAMPWVRIEKSYVFDGPRGPVRLTHLFGRHKQLIIQHLMFAPEWESPCKSCSFWADSITSTLPHLANRDTGFAAVSRAPIAKLTSTAERLGWGFPWVSSEKSDFNYDFGVSFRREDFDAGPVTYNYRETPLRMTDLPGFSTFFKDADGTLYHTYSCYARGLDMLNPTYQFLDLTAMGRHEDGPHPMAWVRLHDEYEQA
ncbi:DUF899 domain-containing protein [Methylovirgula sp. 4M-Z18]|uniref:DUF899 domain-containing protein n=1 Tax=Methylovirgula sp. 4M-Z18 TaxID=2293567 RepID=UPI000E2F90BC|nr:DUF899 domain-containing protein [Methylovirgula sp. 4M-Z18]RFB78948.1 DUF899 domain-containing protein [Methylovirgula sp. 4M-Z18]